MLKTEFEALTGIYPDDALYYAIEREYESKDENGNDCWKDKQGFCHDYKFNVDGLAQKIQHTADERFLRDEESRIKILAEQDERIWNLMQKNEILRTELDRELEWKLTEEAGTNLPQTEYKDMQDHAGESEKLSHADAAEWLYEEFGFSTTKIKIVEKVHTYEVNRHSRMRKKDTYYRPPLWLSTDWNYIRFDCAGMQWECINGELKQYWS